MTDIQLAIIHYDGRNDMPYADLIVGALREKMCKWTDVTVRLPKHTQDYNVVCNVGCALGGFREVRTYRFENIQGREPKWCIPNDPCEVVSITHWAQLPELPEAVE